MKRTISFVLILFLILSLAACGFSSGKDHSTNTKPANTPATTKTAPTSNTESVITDKPVVTDTTASATELVVQTTETPETEEPIPSEDTTSQEHSAPEETEPSDDLYTITFDIEFLENLIFSRYDVDFKIDGVTHKTLAHGVDDVLTFDLNKGTHTLTFSKNGSDSVKGETTFIVTETATYCYKISCFSDKVTVEIKDGGNSSNPVSSSAPSEETPTTEVTEEIKYGINDTITLDNLEYTVTNVTDKKVIDSFWDDGKTDNNFVIITIKIKNIGTRQEYVSPLDFTYTIDQSKYKAHNAALYLDNGLWVGEDIGAGISKSYKLVFEIPEEHKKTDCLVIQTSWFGDEATIYMKKIKK